MKLSFNRLAVLYIVAFLLVGGGANASQTIHSKHLRPIGSAIPPLCAKYDGANLYIAANDGDGTEMCYWFKKCMNNELFTFYRVGVRTVDYNESSLTGVPSSTAITWLNATASDNIGPVAIEGYGYFVGGNHRWRTADSAGNPGRGTRVDTHTALCDSVIVIVDGDVIALNKPVYGSRVKVKVWNTIFDPLVEPQDGDAVLSSPLIGEFATYTISAGSIAVDMEHSYMKNVTVTNYYGMQSMFVNEDSIMTPDGAYASFVASTPKFKKSDYPNFSRFIEHNANGWCQSSWMRPIDLGTHYAISDNSPIYMRSLGKCYHVIINNYPVSEGDTLRWHGIYTWALPIINDGDLLVYKGLIDDKEALYIDVKQACDRTFMLSGANNLRISSYAHNSDGASVEIKSDEIRVSADNPASFILIPKMNGDVNADGMIDVDDVNAIINLIFNYNKYKDKYPGNADFDGSRIVDVDDVNALINIILNLS